MNDFIHEIIINYTKRKGASLSTGPFPCDLIIIFLLPSRGAVAFETGAKIKELKKPVVRS